MQSYLIDNEKSPIIIYNKIDLNNYIKEFKIIESNLGVESFKILFDSGNSSKTFISSGFIHACTLRNCIKEEITKPDETFYEMIRKTISMMISFDMHNNDDYEELYKYLRSITRDHTSEQIYKSIISLIIEENKNLFLTNLSGEKNFLASFISKLNLFRVVGGSGIGGQIFGFKKYTFSFLIEGTEDNFKLKHGHIIPITITAYENNKVDKDILFNNTIIKTLELYNIFIGISDIKIQNINDGKQFSDQINNAIINNHPKDQLIPLQDQLAKTIYYNVPCKKIDCSKNYKKITNKNTNIYLVDKDDKKIQINYTNEILLDTGNGSANLITRSYYNKIKQYTYDLNLTTPKPEITKYLEKIKLTLEDDKEINMIDRFIERMNDVSKPPLISKKIYEVWKETKFFELFKGSLFYLLQIYITIDAGGIKMLTNAETSKLKLFVNGLCNPIEVNFSIFDHLNPNHDKLILNQDICNNFTKNNIYFGNIEDEDVNNNKIKELEISLEVEQDRSKIFDLQQQIKDLKRKKYDPVDIICVTDDVIYEYNLISEKINVKKNINKPKYIKLEDIFNHIKLETKQENLYFDDYRLLKNDFEKFSNKFVKIEDTGIIYTKQFYDNYNCEFNKEIQNLYKSLQSFIKRNISLISKEKRPLLNIDFNVESLYI
jgi:hypothetical protein